MDEFEIAMKDPSCIFASPREVVEHKNFTRDQKIQILKTWEYDMRELQVAEEENMGGGAPNILGEIHSALLALGVKGDDWHSPDKHT